jgi:uncharacterized membrane protein YphA (DoxX/SURF4 family)
VSASSSKKAVVANGGGGSGSGSGGGSGGSGSGSGGGGAFSGWFFGAKIDRWLNDPQPILRLEILRICAPLAILGFMSSRVAHADEWLGNAGFRVPELGVSDYRQPLYLPGLPTPLAWLVAITLVMSGLAVALGYRPRKAAIVFAITAAFVALSDRLAAFSVSKLAPMVGITLALSPCGRRLSVDTWLERRKSKRARRQPLPTHVTSGAVRFIQVLLPVIYSASGIAKCRGDWLSHNFVLWTHLHDTYQTAFTVALANILPASAWTFLQYLTLFFEVLAPLWFSIKKTRTFGMILGVGMHMMIGLMFGPVRYFAMLMSTMLIASYAPANVLDRVSSKLAERVKL